MIGRFLTGKRTAGRILSHDRRARGGDQSRDFPTPHTPIYCGAKRRILTWTKRATFAEAIRTALPGQDVGLQLLPSFNWKRKLDDASIASFQRELGAMGYRFQFITLAGFHALNLSMYELAPGYRDHGMTAYAALQVARICLRSRRRLSSDQASTLRRHRLFRPGDAVRVARQGVDHGAHRLDRRSTVRTGNRRQWSRPSRIGGTRGHVHRRSQSGPARHERNTIWSTD